MTRLGRVHSEEEGVAMLSGGDKALVRRSAESPQTLARPVLVDQRLG